MQIKKTNIDGLYVIEPDIIQTIDGETVVTYDQKKLKKIIGDIEFIQDNESCSKYGVIRGLHFQIPPHSQSKLLTCIQGKILDVAVDLRKNSATYGCNFSIELSEDNHLLFFIPHGFAHGFVSLVPNSIVQYKCDNFYTPSSEGGICAIDPDLNIDWKVNLSDAIISMKDQLYPRLKDFKSPF